MANNIVDYIIKISTSGTTSVDHLTNQTDSLNDSVSRATTGVNKLFKVLGGAAVVAAATRYVSQATEAYKQSSTALTTLTQVMRNTQGATDEHVNSVVKLIDAQQKLGVISNTVQMSGAKELGTYLSKTESMQKLIPVMNDMLAQQYGLNTTQEQAINIATMMGKVMDGQTGALSRYGYKFDEAQERILKYGTEAQRAATLADVVSASVGGVNKALAATPEGVLQREANLMANIHSMSDSDLKQSIQDLSSEGQFFPLRMKLPDLPEWTFPTEPLISIRGKNTTVKRSVAKAYSLTSGIRGTVKERWNQDDYDINITGVFCDFNNDGEYPRRDVERLRTFCESKQVIEVLCPLFEIFGITQMVIDDWDIPFTAGENLQAYSITASSDFQFQLLIDTE